LFDVSASTVSVPLLSNYLHLLTQIWNAQGNADNRLPALWRAFRWYSACHGRTVPEDHPVLHPVFGDRLFPCYLDSIVARDVMYRSEWFDYEMLKFMQAFLHPEDHFLDVGANTGLHTLLASTCLTTGRITCVEPDPKNLKRLRHLIALNQINNAVVHELAASDTSGHIVLEGVDVFARMTPGTHAAGQGKTQVATARLDELLGKTARVDYCKIDVEGAEWQVLKGMTEWMQRQNLPVVVFEMNGSLHAYGYQEEEFLSWLQAKGYRLANYRHRERTLRMGPPYDDNIFALTAEGIELASSRIPGLRIQE
jgi:FkbM family methyltransferase